MKSLFIEFAKLNVFAAIQNSEEFAQVKSVLMSCGISQERISQVFHVSDLSKPHDLIFYDLVRPRFVQEMLFHQIKTNSENLHKPLVILTEPKQEVNLIGLDKFANVQILNKPLCPKVFYLRMHLQLLKTRDTQDLRGLTATNSKVSSIFSEDNMPEFRYFS